MPDRTQQTVKERTSSPEIELLGPETAGALAERPRDAAALRGRDPDVDGSGAPRGEGPLRMENAGGAARAVAGAAAAIDFSAVRPGPALAAMRDEIDDATAEAIRMRRRNAAAPVERAIEGPRPEDPLLVEGPARPPKAPNTLPAVLDRALVGRYEEWVSAREDPRWLTIYDLPGYRANAIRALGRTTFRMFPCFAAHERQAAEDVGDPLGEIAMMAHFSGRQGPSEKAHLDQVAGWLRQNGTTIDATVLEFPGVFEGYRPEIILTLSEDRSYLMVRDSLANGAPVDGLYVYSWKGGLAHYRSNLLDAERVAALLQGVARRPAIEGRAGAARPPRAIAPSRRLAIAAPAVDPATINLGRGMSETGRTALAALPQASSPADRGRMIGSIKALGFKPSKDAAGRPVFRRTGSDGSVVDLEPDDGLPLARSSSFKATTRDGSGQSGEHHGVADPARLEDLVRNGGRGPSPSSP